MATSCCIIGCPTVVNAHNTARLFAFPQQDTTEYTRWIANCKASEENIRQLRNPMICPLHFSYDVMLSGKLLSESVPLQYLDAKELKILNQQMGSVHHLCAEWLTLIRKRTPEMIVNGNMLRAKAKEVASIFKFNNFDIDLGWLHNFELYLHLNGISHWRDRPKNLSNFENENRSMTDSLENEVSIVDMDSEQSIQTYGEALEKLQLLEDYVKRTTNKNAMELIANVRDILNNTSE